MSTVLCSQCGTPMNVRGAISQSDEYVCDSCRNGESAAMREVLSQSDINLDLIAAAAEAMKQPKRNTMEAREGLWGSEGMFLHTMHVTENGEGFVPSLELIDGVNQEDALKKTMNRVRILETDPRTIRIVIGKVMTEMRREPPGAIELPFNRINGS